MEIQFWIRDHDHPLRLQIEQPLRLEITNQFSCQVCHSLVKAAPFYFCDECTGFRVHKSCEMQPRQIQHPFHPHSRLTNIPLIPDICSNCLSISRYSYVCDSCEYHLCVRCALIPLATTGNEGQDWIRDLHHAHPLRRVDGDQHRKCIACKSSQSHQDDLYGCSKCQYFMHKPCSHRPPQQLHLPVRCHHRGKLTRDVIMRFNCDMCKIRTKYGFNLAYSCKKCSLSVCFKCAEVAWTSKGSLKYEDHDHPLCLVEDTDEIAWHSLCTGYDDYCAQPVVTSSDEFRRTASTMMWCYQCGFRIHLLCSPLPSEVKHELHIHSLVLVDSMREDESGEYYCDICETQRDPLIRLYCCQKCKYYAHVHCLLPEILKLLGGDLKNVALKTVNQDLWNVPNRKLQIEKLDSTLTLKDVINQISANEKKIIVSYYKWDEAISEDTKSFKAGEEEIDEILPLSHFTYGTFESFWSHLQDLFTNRKDRVELKASELASKVVKVKGYWIPYPLAPLLKKLLPFHYEFLDSVFFPKSLEFRSFVLFIQCKAVKSMHTTMPRCITKDHLQEWHYHISFAERQRVEVSFAQKQLRVLVHAFLGFQAERLREEIPRALAKRIAELQRKLDECNTAHRSSPESKYMKFCSNQASEFKWKINAFEGSFNYQNLNDFKREDEDKD